jgi:hypothetical protein
LFLVRHLVEGIDMLYASIDLHMAPGISTPSCVQPR